MRPPTAAPADEVTNGDGSRDVEVVGSADVGDGAADHHRDHDGGTAVQRWTAEIGEQVPWVGEVASGKTRKGAAGRIGRNPTWVRQNWTRLTAALADIGNDVREDRLTIERVNYHLRRHHVLSSLRPIVLGVVVVMGAIFAALFVRRLDDVRAWLRGKVGDDGDRL